MVKSMTETKRVKRQSNNDQQIVTLPGWGLPPRLRVRLRASSSYNVSHIGALQVHGVSCNNPFQPFITVSTTELPSYLAYLSTAYAKSYVECSNIHVELINSTVNDSITTVLAFDGDTTGPYTINSLAESRDAQARVIGNFSAGSNRTVFRSQFTPQRYLSIAANSPSNMCASAAPSEQYYWNVGWQSIAGASGNIGARINVEYDVVFTELVMPAL